MTTKDKLIELVQGLNEGEAADVLDYTEWLLQEEDDDELTPAELARVERAEADMARGEYVPLEDVHRRLGL